MTTSFLEVWFQCIPVPQASRKNPWCVLFAKGEEKHGTLVLWTSDWVFTLSRVEMRLMVLGLLIVTASWCRWSAFCNEKNKTFCLFLEQLEREQYLQWTRVTFITLCVLPMCAFLPLRGGGAVSTFFFFGRGQLFLLRGRFRSICYSGW